MSNFTYGTVPGNLTIERYISYLRASGSPATTITTRRSHLRRVARCLGDLTAVNGDQLVTWAGVQDWAVETRRGYRGTLRGFYLWAVEAGLTDCDASASLPKVKPSTPTPRPAPDPTYRTALTETRTPRVHLMLRLGGEAGMRRAEVAAVHSRDLIDDLNGRSLRVVGKGGKLRVIPLTDDLASEVARVARKGGYLFPGNDQGHLSARWVGKLVTRALADDVTMHQLRHRFATRVFAQCRDTFTTQDLLGHASSETTRRYVVVPPDYLREAVGGAA